MWSPRRTVRGLLALAPRSRTTCRPGRRMVPIVSVIAPFSRPQLHKSNWPSRVLRPLSTYAHNGGGDLLRITQLGVVQISDDNAACADDHTRHWRSGSPPVHS